MTTKSKRTTAADIAAAVRLGAMPADAEVMTADDIRKIVAEAERTAAASQPAMSAAASGSRPPATEHDCAIPGCRHGAAHGPSQPDRQLKLACGTCGAVIRMTKRAMDTAGGPPTCADGGAFSIAPRRTYNRKAA